AFASLQRDERCGIRESGILSMTAIFIYTTCPTDAEARAIAAALLDARLIACANIMAPHTSLYEWQGKREEGTEVATIMKSRAALFNAIRDKILSLHSYDYPCIVSLPIADGHPEFLRWIDAQTT